MSKTLKELVANPLAKTASNSPASPYSEDFYTRFTSSVSDAARICVPEILKLLSVRSVVDVGCGIGEWLATFAQNGIEDYLGIDGAHIRDSQLLIPVDRIERQDLAKGLKLNRSFDLALSLEVAEHLPASCADQFVKSLTDLAPAVVFSAAIPGQGGVHHVNEQWPWFWHEKFARFGFVYLDPFRKHIWQKPQIPAYYQQNMFLYVNPKVHERVITSVGQPDRLNELTLVRTVTLRSLVEGGRVRRLFARGRRKLSKWFRRR